MDLIEALKIIGNVHNKYYKFNKSEYLAFFDYDYICYWNLDRNIYRQIIYLENAVGYLADAINVEEVFELPTDPEKELATRLNNSKYYQGELSIPFPSSNLIFAPSHYHIEHLFQDFTVRFDNTDYIILCPALLQHVNSLIAIFDRYKHRLNNGEELYKDSYNKLIDIRNKAQNVEL